MRRVKRRHIRQRSDLKDGVGDAAKAKARFKLDELTHFCQLPAAGSPPPLVYVHKNSATVIQIFFYLGGKRCAGPAAARSDYIPIASAYAAPVRDADSFASGHHHSIARQEHEPL